MCGITGIYAFSDIGRMFMIRMQSANNALTHRGPDAGMLFNNDYVGLGHRRLAIIDLSPLGLQPMSDESGRFQIVFNGEIFNYKELKEGLLSKGHTFESDSDTEVLLKLLITQGIEKTLPQLNGFFSFCFYDSKTEDMWVVRDRYGIKPLLFYIDEDKFVFASEMSSLMVYNIPRELDYTSLFQYFQLHYIPAPNTIFKNVYKLEPGHFLKIRPNGVFTKQCWYEFPENKAGFSGTYEQAIKELKTLLEDSVRLRMVSDVPLGTFLSGGIDSSIVSTIAKKYHKDLQTFSIGYADEPFFDETKYANAVAKKIGSNHTVLSLTNNDIYEGVEEMLEYLSEPFADSSAIPFYVLSKRVRKHMTVALSGDGADELFAGYNKYAGAFKAQNPGIQGSLLKSLRPILKKFPQSRNSFFSNKVRQALRFTHAMELSEEERYWFLSTFRTEDQVKEWLSPSMNKVSMESYFDRKTALTQGVKGKGIQGYLYADGKMLLPNDMLHKADSMSMAASLEVRVPFLDYRLVQWVSTLPEAFKLDGNSKKKILQDAYRTELPAELYHRPKKGFDVPLRKGFETVLKPLIEKCMSEDLIQRQGIFNPHEIKLLKTNVLSSGSYEQNSVWALLVFQKFWLKYVDGWDD